MHSEDEELASTNRLTGWFQKGSIQAQVGRVFNLFAVLVLVLGMVATIGSVRMEQRSSDLQGLTNVAFLTASMTRNVGLAKDNMGAFHSRGFQAESMDEALARAQDATAINARVKGSVGSLGPAFVVSVGEVDAGLARLIEILGEVRDAPRDVVDTEAFLGPRYDEIDQVVNKIAALREIAAKRVEEQSGEGLNEIQILIGALAIGVLLALGLVLLGKRIVANRVVSPMVAISDASERIAEGETELEIPETGREDEIGKLSAALNVLRHVQKRWVEQAKRQHEAELEKQRAIEEERENQRASQSRLLQALADKFEQTISDVANEVAAASAQMHRAASGLAEDVETASKTFADANDNLKQSSAGITGAASASDEFAMSISEVSQQAGSSSQRARRATEAMEAADVTITGLTDSADRISQIIEVIAGIAQRTNLLALNASIEAARGGEAGRGFAVVASEVKELATQTGRATEEVETLIRNMQSATSDSAAALGVISKEVHELETTALAIATAVDQQAVASQDLAQSIDMAARNTQTVSLTIDDVSKVAQTSGETASQVLESSSSLSEQARLLREQVSEFLGQVRAA